MERKSGIVQELQARLQQSENDKKVLQKSIEQLNECYQIKIEILECTLEQYGQRIEELLLLKKEGIEQELSGLHKYEQENSRLHTIIAQLETAFQEERAKMEAEVKLKDDHIYTIASEKEELYSKSRESEQKIDQLVREHTKEIEELKKQLSILKEEIESVEGSRINKELMISKEYSTILEDNKAEESNTENELAFKEITNPKNIKDKHPGQVDEETRIKQLAYRSPLGPISRNN